MNEYDQWKTGDPCRYKHCKKHGAWVSDGDPHSECPDCYDESLDEMQLDDPEPEV